MAGYPISHAYLLHGGVMLKRPIDLADPMLWGNEAGEDEDLDYLSTYFLRSESYNRVMDESWKIVVATSKKGVGKSTLLRKGFDEKSKDEGVLSVYIKASDLVSLMDGAADNYDDYINLWLRRICTKLNYEIGSRIGFAWSDDQIAMVESSEIAGFKNRNLLSALMDRLSIKTLDSKVERKRIQVADHVKLFMRYQSDPEMKVWIFIDDIDATFRNTQADRMKCTSFLNACRNLVRDINNVHVRVALRSDVWAILKQSDESMDKVEQYLIEIKWSDEQMGKIMVNKIKSYIVKNNLLDYCDFGALGDMSKVSQFVFERSYPWGNGRIAPYKAAHVLSYGRPRWESQLHRIAGEVAKSKNSAVITHDILVEAMPRYGKLKVDDIYREHGHQFPDIVNLIEIFSNKAKRYSTNKLLETVTKGYVETYGAPEIDGKTGSKNVAIDIARFLYRVGFIAGRDTKCENPPGFVRFDDRPNLLTSRANLDDGMSWEIHPAYRGYLRIGNLWPNEKDVLPDIEG